MSVALGIFGRAPVAGRTKTRLIPALGPEGAASFYTAMLHDVLDHARAAEGFALAFWSADDSPSETLDALLGDIPRRVQCEGGLGARMEHALERGLRAHDRALLIGSDVPTLPTSLLHQAAAALEAADVVIAPSDDGGYGLIGARRVRPGMFEGVRFSTAHTCTDTERALRAAGLEVERVGPCNDVDTPADLAALRRHLRVAVDRAPRSALWLMQNRPHAGE